MYRFICMRELVPTPLNQNKLLKIKIQLCQIYTKIHIYTISYRNKNRSYSSKRNKSENDDIPDKPNCNSDFLQLLCYSLYFYF